MFHCKCWQKALTRSFRASLCCSDTGPSVCSTPTLLLIWWLVWDKSCLTSALIKLAEKRFANGRRAKDSNQDRIDGTLWSSTNNLRSERIMGYLCYKFCPDLMPSIFSHHSSPFQCLLRIPPLPYRVFYSHHFPSHGWDKYISEVVNPSSFRHHSESSPCPDILGILTTS